MHPELVYRLAQLRREELINSGHRRRTRTDRRAFWRRRRGHEPTGDDRRVA